MSSSPSCRGAVVVVAAITLVLGAVAPGRALGQGASYEQLQTFSSLLNQIRVSYVDSVTYSELVHAAIDGVLSSLDPHSRFERREDAEREMAYEAGALAGTGIAYDLIDDRIVVFAVHPKGPGARAGVSPGDRLLAINDTAVVGFSPEEAGRHLIGEKGKKVRLLFERGSRLEPDSVRVTIKLDNIPPLSIGSAGLADPTTGYIRLLGFHPKGGEELEKAVKEVKAKGAKRLLLDLRGNPGGSVYSAEQIVSLFLTKGTLVYRVETRRSADRWETRTEKAGTFVDLPLILLIDNGSASASELVAASLQDHDRALILGRRSFGKALVQRGFPVPPQGDMVWLTTGRVVTPSGRVVQRSYRGLKTEQYYTFAGKTGAEQDTLALFHTDHGREVRGGGGIQPDVLLPGSPDLPAWWSVAVDSGWYETIADSVATLLPKAPAKRLEWFDALSEWRTRLVQPLLVRVHGRLGIAATPDSSVLARLGRILAHRASEVRWGAEAGDEFVLHNDPDIQAAMGYWDRIDSLLGGAAQK
jgi:carboxyl-terminal processing protease